VCAKVQQGKTDCATILALPIQHGIVWGALLLGTFVIKCNKASPNHAAGCGGVLEAYGCLAASLLTNHPQPYCVKESFAK